MASKKLSGEQIQRLEDALTDAFSTLPQLKRMVRIGLDQNLEKIASGDTLTLITFSLIEWAEAQGWTERLIAAARAQSPDNLLLQAFDEEYQRWISEPQESRRDKAANPAVAFQQTPVTRLGFDLTLEEQALLVNAQDQEGVILLLPTDYGFIIKAGKLRVGGQEGSAATGAAYEDGLESLIQRKLVKLVSSSERGGGEYRLTGTGFKVAQALAPKPPSVAPPPAADRLSQEERGLLRSAASNFEIRYLTSNESAWVQAGSDYYGDRNDPSVVVRYKEALDKLCKQNYAWYSGGNLYKLTNDGITLAKKLASQSAT
jgi:hypothetical protein